MRRRKWTDPELHVLKERYGTMSRKELQEKYLPDRTLQTIAQKAMELGLTRGYVPWSDKENECLMQGWAELPRDRLLGLLPGRTWTQCRNQVKKLKTAGVWPSGTKRNYAAIEPEERKRRSELYETSLRYKMGLGHGTSVKSFQNNKIPKNNKTGVRGVSRTKSGKFTAYVRFQGKLRYLGTFPSLEDAAAARDDAIKELRPEIDRIAGDIAREGRDEQARRQGPREDSRSIPGK